jgi:hypothetical protein
VSVRVASLGQEEDTRGILAGAAKGVKEAAVKVGLVQQQDDGQAPPHFCQTKNGRESPVSQSVSLSQGVKKAKEIYSREDPINFRGEAAYDGVEQYKEYEKMLAERGKEKLDGFKWHEEGGSGREMNFQTKPEKTEDNEQKVGRAADRACSLLPALLQWL